MNTEQEVRKSKRLLGVNPEYTGVSSTRTRMPRQPPREDGELSTSVHSSDDESTSSQGRRRGASSMVSGVSNASLIARMRERAKHFVAEELAKLDKQRADDEEQFAKEEMEIARKELERKREAARKTMEREKELIRLREAEELAAIAEEEENLRNEQYLSEDETDESKVDKRTDDWVQNSPMRTNEHEQAAQVPQAQPSSSTPTTPTTVPFSKEQLSMLLEAQMNIRTQAAAPGGDSMAKFIARQSSSKVLTDFNGNPEDWPSFISEYRVSSEQCQFSNVENINRLRKCLKGKAKESVQAMMVSPDNIDTVLETLEMNFGRPELIVETLVAKSKKVPNPREDRPETLIDFSNAVRNLVTTISTLKKQNHMMNPILIKELVEKLPPTIKEKWGEHIFEHQDDVTLQTLSDWLYKRAKIACLISTPRTSTETKPQEDKKKNWNKPNDKSKANKKDAILMTAHDEQKSEVECLFCKKSKHDIRSCRSFKNEDEQNRWTWSVENKVCFCCLRQGHPIVNCKYKKCCGVNNCKSTHHPLLHKKTVSPPEGEKEASKPEQETATEDVPVIHSVCKESTGNRVLLQILPVTLKGPKGTIATFAILDSGSKGTFVSASITNKLGVKGEKGKLNMKWLIPVPPTNLDTEYVSLKISGADNKEYNLQNVRTVKNLELPLQSVNIRKFIDKWKHLKEFNIQDLSNAKPMILIGQDNPSLIISRKTVEGPPNAPMMSLTKLGWVLHGPDTSLKERTEEDFTLTTWYEQKDSDYLHDLIKESFSTDSFGVRPVTSLPKSKEDVRSEKIINETMKRVDKRWETGLLWKDDNAVLPPSKVNAFNRLRTIERKMDKYPEFAEQYCQKIDSYVQKGYARKLNEEEVKLENPKTWILPHFGVFNPNKPGKLRFVFDAAAKSCGTSLNDFLMTGPDNLTPLVSVLLNFRINKIAICGDIQEMFHQVKVRTEDCPAQRFLWRGMNRERKPDVFQMSVMTFGATCSPSLAQEAKNRNAELFKKQFPEAAEAIQNKHYVDDYLDSVNSVEEAKKRIKEVSFIHEQGGFKIVNWLCSSREVLATLPEEIRANNNHSLESKSDLPTERLLGLYWDPNTDEFTFKCKFNKVKKEILSGEKIPTKRETSQLTMSVFDPLGFLCHYTIKAKIIQQDIWRSRIGWDDEIPADINEKWQSWLQELQNIEQFKIRRCYSTKMKEATSIQMHVFVDASEQAFSAVMYLRIQSNKEVEVMFVTAKTRVAPLKIISIPKLELQAAVLGSRLAGTVKDILNVKIDKIIYWSDSSAVLDWFISTKKQPTFIACRVGEIAESTNLNNWRWVPSGENPADDATRDCHPSDLTSTSRWLNGPPFLKEDETLWPVLKKRNSKNDESDSDSNVIEENDEDEQFVFATSNYEPPLDVKKFSSWIRLKRTVGWVLRFIKNLPTLKSFRNSKNNTKNNRRQELTVAELEKAEQVCLRSTQKESFSEDIYLMSTGKEINRKSRLLQLSPILDNDGLLRLEGRMQRAEQAHYDMKCPIILEPKHHVTRLIIKHYHEKSAHQGHETVMNNLRQRFWIINIRAAVKKAWNDCRVCKIAKTVPVPPMMGQLPPERLQRQARPFIVTGLDYFGPMEVTVRRSREKRYGALFTCLTTRAVHVELVNSLNTDSAISAIRRFVARRGYPVKIYSDNGTNFKGADNELKKALEDFDQDKITSELGTKGIEWHFIPPSAPHMGGCWERLVKSIKVTLKATLKSVAPREETLVTLLTEAENIVNSHPLTHVSIHHDDKEALTPNHFLLGTTNAVPAPGVFTPTDLCLRKQWRITQQLTEQFWKRWVNEYLPTLTRRNKWHTRTPPVKIGDIVIIADGNLPRNQWPKGVVTAAFPGKDGVVRVADVKTQTSIFRRPVAKLCVLDVTSDEEDRVAAKPEVEERDVSPLEGVCPLLCSLNNEHVQEGTNEHRRSRIQPEHEQKERSRQERERSTNRSLTDSEQARTNYCVATSIVHSVEGIN